MMPLNYNVVFKDIHVIRKINENGIKVAFSGTGADELFTGYYDHYNLHLFEMSKSKKIQKNFK